MIYIVVRGGSLAGCFTDELQSQEDTIKVIDMDEYQVGDNCISILHPKYDEGAVKDLENFEEDD